MDNTVTVVLVFVAILVMIGATDSSIIVDRYSPKLSGDSNGHAPPPTVCGKRFTTDYVASGYTLLAKSCNNSGDIRCGQTNQRFEYCTGQNWITMCPCSYRLQEQRMGTRINPGRSCNDILIKSGGQVQSGTYWIAPTSSAYPFRVFCDMKTAGGGWTLVAKVKGNDALMNRINTAQWRDGRLIGSTHDLKDENALGLAYSILQFRDVMIRSLTNGQKHLAWRHPVTYQNIQSIVKSCTRVANGVKLSGSIHQLDYKGNQAYHHGCTELVYGFMGGDCSYALTTVAGCPKGYKHGHTGAIIGAFLDPPSGDRNKNGQNVRCVTDFGVGGGYRDMKSGIATYAINAHYWGSANSNTNSWNSQAIFIR